MPFICSLLTPVEEPRPTSSTAPSRPSFDTPRKPGLNSGFLAILLSLASVFGVFGANDFASAAELIGTSPGVGTTLFVVPGQVVFRFDGPLETFGTALYVNGKRVSIGVAERGRDAQEAILYLNGLNVAGTYEVFWEATAVDASISKGKIRFVVKAPSKKILPAKPAPTIPPTRIEASPVNSTPVPAEGAAEPAVNQSGTGISGTGETPSGDKGQDVPNAPNPAPTNLPAPLPGTGATQLTIVVTTTITGPATTKPKATKAPQRSTTSKTPTLQATPSNATPGATATSITTAPTTKNADISVDPTAESRTPTPQRPGSASTVSSASSARAASTSVNASRLAKTTTTTTTAGVKGTNATSDSSLLGKAPTTPTLADSNVAVTKRGATTTTILLSPDTVPATDIEVSFEGPDGSIVNGPGDGPVSTNPTTTRKKSPSITDILESTTPDASTSNGSSSVAPDASSGAKPQVKGAASKNPSRTTEANRPKTEAEIVSGTDALSPDVPVAATTATTATTATKDLNTQASGSTKSSSLQTGRFARPLRLAGAGALAAMLLGLLALFASVRAPIAASARLRMLTGFGNGFLFAILALGVLALGRELLATPKSWPRFALKSVGFAALTTFALIRRRSLKRGLSVLSHNLPLSSNARVHTALDPVVQSHEIDELVPKSLRLSGTTSHRSIGRHVPELARRLRKASFAEAVFGAFALLVAAALLFV